MNFRADKKYFLARGLEVFSVDEAIELIIQVMSELVGPNNWAKVLEWIKKYGKSPGLDFSKILGS